MRLIDADPLREQLKKRIEETENVLMCRSLETFMRLLDLTPTADAEPARHGYWKHERLLSTSGGSYAVVRCSVCEYQHPMTETNYCPNCGAKMGGVKDGE